MSEEENQDIPMGQCGACNAIVPLDSESCPSCGVRFGGVTEEELGECGACGAIIPADSESCPECGASFVANDDTEAITESEEESEDSEIVEEEIADVETEDNTEDSSDEEESEIEEQEEELESSDNDTIEGDEESETVIDSEPEEMEDSTTEEESEVHEEEGDIDSQTDDFDDDSDEEDDDDDSEEEDAEEESEEAEADEEDDDDDSEEEDAEEESEEDAEEDDTEEEEEIDDGIEDSAVVMAFDNLALAIADSGMTAAEAFGEIDTSEDNLIDAPELQKGIEKIAGEKLSPKHVTAILDYLDKDGNRRIDPNELIKALEDLRIGIQPGKVPKVKTFPSPMQKFLMGKKANDIFYPIAYFLMVTFIGVWVVNGMGLLVDGTGGTIVYEGGVDSYGEEVVVTNWNLCQSDALEVLPDPCFGTVEVGETYPCDPAVDPDDCANSLTPFSGDDGASSMPAGFYTDGIIMMVLGAVGLGLTAFLHLIYAPALREKVKEKSGKTSSESSEEEDDDDDSDEEDDDDDSEEEDDDDDSDEEDDDDDSDEEDDDDDSDEEDDDDDSDEEDDDDDYDDDIDIGDWVGLDIDGEEFFGEIVEFDDDEGTVTIETEDGEEVTGDQDDMFLEDEDDE